MRAEAIKRLAEEIRKNPDDADGVVDFNTSKIIEICNEEIQNRNVDDYEIGVAGEITKMFLGGK